MGTHSVCPTVMCNITVGLTTTNYCCFVRHVLLDCSNWISCRVIHVLHNLGGFHSLDVCHGELQYIASAYLASSIAFDAAVWPTVAGCFAPRFPHDPQAPARLSESPCELGLVTRLPLDLRRHCSPCWHDAYTRLQWRDRISLSALGDMSKKGL